MAAYGTPSSRRVPPGPSIGAGSGRSCAGGGSGRAGVGTVLLTSGGRERSISALPASGRTKDLSVGPAVLRHELHVVLLGGRLHAREVRDERRLIRGGVVGLGAHVLEEPLEAAGEGAHHPGVLDDLVGVREAGRHVAEVAGVSSCDCFWPSG